MSISKTAVIGMGTMGAQIGVVCARGGFELSFSWDNGFLNEVEVLSKAGQACRLQYDGKTVEFPTQKGQRIRLDGGLNLLNP